MGTNEAEAAGSSGSGGSFPPAALPWHQIPKFEPGVTDLRVYSNKLSFLKDIWPAEHIHHLGPRAALLVEGAAFQSVSRLKAEKLKDKDGVKHLVEALGGIWGRLAEEDRYDLFERALYGIQQKGDESNDSYINRHSNAFEDMLGKDVKMKEVQAYVLLRQSTLSSDDRKRIILESGGKLDFDDAKKNMRLLGSKFFQDLQGQGRGGNRQKTYDVNYVDDHEEQAWHVTTTETEVDEEWTLMTLLEEGDEDAAFIQDFEEQILLCCQESAELAACFVSYQEARDRIVSRRRQRPVGFGQPRVRARASTPEARRERVHGLDRGLLLDRRDVA